MTRFLSAIALVTTLAAPAIAAGPAVQEEGKDRPAAEVLKENPDSVEAMQAYMTETAGAILSSIESDPDGAEKKLGEMKALLDSLKPESEEAKQLLERMKTAVPFINQQITLSRTSLDELQAKLSEAPDDAEALTLYASKLSNELRSMAYSDPVEANARLDKARAFLAEVREKATDQGKAAFEQVDQVLEQAGSAIESNLARAALVGKDAAPLAVEAWANGEPITDSDLKGKVVLLDFWAVWCGPCIATFPHLIEWNKQYGDKGLVIIGLTSYYGYDWDEQAGQAVPKPGTTPEQERAMLEKFAAGHGLTHRFAIQEGDALSEFYLVSGIPQAVVIDQEGKVRMIRVGSGDQNAEDIGGLIEELLGSPTKAGE